MYLMSEPTMDFPGTTSGKIKIGMGLGIGVETETEIPRRIEMGIREREGIGRKGVERANRGPGVTNGVYRATRVHGFIGTDHGIMMN